MPDPDATEALRRQRAFLRQVIDLNPNLIFAKDRDGRFTLVNQAVANIYGTTVEALIGKSDADFNPNREQVEFFRRMDLAVMDSAEPSVIPEEVITDAAGRTHWLQTVKIPIVADDGSVDQILGVATDITDRKHTEQALRESLERFRLVSAATQDLIFDRDLLADRLWHNEPAQRLFGTGQWIEGGTAWLADRLHPADRERVVAGLKAADASGANSESHEARVRRWDGNYATLLVRANLIRDPSGRVVRVIGTATDVTEQRRLEDQLRQSQKMEAIGRLAGGIAHDFNNLLLVIRGCSDRMVKAIETGEPTRTQLQAARLIQAAGERATSLTRQLLAFSRKQVIKPATLDLGAIVRELDPMLRRLLGDDVELMVESAQTLDAIHADPTQLEQVIMNLAVNARDAMPDGGTLCLSTANVSLDAATAARHGPDARPGPHVRLTVTDTGCGMDAATLGRIFEPFFTTKEVGKGTGLGLSTVYGIVRQSNGHIVVQSEPNRGTRFEIYFPRSDEPISRSTTTAASSPAPPGSETVLLAEDDDLVRAFTRTALEEAGYRVLAAHDGDEALRLATNHDPIHLLVTDVVMPRMSGKQLAERMTAARPSLRVLYMSAYPDVSGLDVHENGFLQKPFTADALARKVREVLAVALK
jgi:two-component system, cell cycle sensor histidine kinase and response regulator CckA